MFSNNVLLAGVLAFAASTHAHMIMNTPTPYGYTTVTSSPLDDDTGIKFPCQTGNRADAFEADGASNPMVVGENNLLNFTGSAVHGGGSCQLSVTYDYPPPADKSKWKVIHSYIGACPAQAVGNLASAGTTDGYGRPYTSELCGGSTGTECLRSYEFQIPEGMKNGNATLAWTWFNKMGNREMYMNCAPVSISGGSDDDSFFNSLPDMFVANVAGSDQSECNTDLAGGVIGFPNPGNFVTLGEAITPGAQGDCDAAGSTTGSTDSSSDSSSSVASSSSAAATSDALSVTYSAIQAGRTSVSADPETTVQSTTLLTMTGYASSAVSSSAVSSSAVSSAAASSAAAYPTAASSAAAYPTAMSTGSSSSGNSSCETGKVSCTSPGNVVCIGDSQFGICNIDHCAVPQPLADGTFCTDGVVNKRDVVRRSHRHLAGHLRKRDF